MANYELTQDIKKVTFQGNNCKDIMFNNEHIWPIHKFRFDKSLKTIAVDQEKSFTYDSTKIFNIAFKTQSEANGNLTIVSSAGTYTLKGTHKGYVTITAYDKYTNEVHDVIIVEVTNVIMQFFDYEKGYIDIIPGAEPITIYIENTYFDVSSDKSHILTVNISASDDGNYIYFDLLSYDGDENNYWVIGNEPRGLYFSRLLCPKRVIMDIEKWSETDENKFFIFGHYKEAARLYTSAINCWTVTDIP